MDTIEFYEATTNRRRKRVAIRISDHMAVTKEGRILNPQTGKPWFRFGFANLKDAVEFAHWIDGMLRPYYPLLHVFDEHSVFAVLKWTLPDGVRMYEFIRALGNGQRIGKVDLQRAWLVAGKQQWRWFGIRRVKHVR